MYCLDQYRIYCLAKALLAVGGSGSSWRSLILTEDGVAVANEIEQKPTKQGPYHENTEGKRGDIQVGLARALVGCPQMS